MQLIEQVGFPCVLPERDRKGAGVEVYRTVEMGEKDAMDWLAVPGWIPRGVDTLRNNGRLTISRGQRERELALGFGWEGGPLKLPTEVAFPLGLDRSFVLSV